MAGHSKWANIRFRKGAQDKKRGKIFTKISRELTVAAREGGEDLESNAQLRMIVDKAFQNNMTKDAVNRAIAKGAGNLAIDDVMNISYEGHGIKGVACIVECLTDNKNRSASEVRHAFSKHGGSLGKEGSVAYLFDHISLIVLKQDQIEETALFDLAIEHGAEDIEKDQDCYMIKSPITAHTALSLALKDKKLMLEHTAIVWQPKDLIKLSEDAQASTLKMIQKLEDLDDVQDIYHNAELTITDADT